MEQNNTRFEEWVRCYSGEMYRYAYWLAQEHGTAQDLVQEAFARAWKYVHTLEDPKQARTWLMTIIRRENARRFERKQQPVSVDPSILETIPEESDVDPRVEDLRLHLKRLSPGYREPLIMQAILGYSCEDIARDKRMTKAAVMTRLSRARKMLKAEMESDECSHSDITNRRPKK